MNKAVQPRRLQLANAGDDADIARVPAGGWDKVRDIEQAKRLFLDSAGILNGSRHDARHLGELAERAFKLGISAQLCAQLIIDIQKPPVTNEAIRDGIERGYAFMFAMDEEPGVDSAVGASDHFDWPEAEDEFDFEGGDPNTRRWPFSIDYPYKDTAAQNAQLFVARRPSKLIFAENVFYSLERNRVWREISPDALAAEIRATDPELRLDVDRIGKVVRALRQAHFTAAKPFDWIAPPPDAPAPEELAVFGNGALNIEARALIPHSGRLFITGLPEYPFDEAAECLLWLECLDQWLHPSFHPTLQEFFGYSLTPSTAHESLLLMSGSPRSGKGTITHILQKLVGPDLFVSRTMNDLAGEFGLECAPDKRLLFIPDAGDADPSRRSVVIERIKSITGNDVLSINRKNKPIINAKLAAKIVLVCNRHPKLLDDSTALAARELAIIFRNSFIGKEDRDLRRKLECELPGIANWALAGLDRLRANGRFTIGELGKAAAREIAESQSPALRFAKDHLDVTGQKRDFTPLALIYERYEQWADYAEGLSGRERRNRDDFKTDLISVLGSRGVASARRRWRDPAKRIGSGGRERGLSGVKLRPME